ncbi:DUF2594 family protein [Candidatus Pantoea carbekii]|uniref:YecF protein n=1 Tax=Candidatus Pantoea carbekii TaxID=1235990 RepID=U3U3D8_9GAMM|nr:DUF2594 family protein [Candidatus Pantoea carbekii]AKC32145.1 hypothetical protein BMSBPS_0335 [Candidatus Pantoea carbekii]BAO00671.1 YecF protein [Candidatus Pantoea carbekii]
MGNQNFLTSQEIKKLGNEIACLKMIVTFMLKMMGQADAGKVIISMERYIQMLDDKVQAEIFRNTIMQIKAAYSQ